MAGCRTKGGARVTSPSLRLVLVRHGETSANVRKELDAAPPGPPLTELGARQAAELADSLTAEPVVAVYASVALRAQQTAAPVAEKLGLTVRVVDGLHEVVVGHLEGRADEEAVRTFFGVFHEWTAGKLDEPMPGGENGWQAIERFSATVRRICDTHSSGTVVVVCHGAIIRLVGSWMAANISDELVERKLIPNTGRIVLAADQATPTGWRCLEWPDVPLTELR
jgi:broad specificity phosphatase PhoE